MCNLAFNSSFRMCISPLYGVGFFKNYYKIMYDFKFRKSNRKQDSRKIKQNLQLEGSIYTIYLHDNNIYKKVHAAFVDLWIA